MTTLYAFGCSNTYGFGLPDCWDYKKKIQAGPPSQYAYPALVANELGFDLTNNSECGVSNKWIMHLIQNTTIEDNSIVLVHWTATNRWCIHHDDCKQLHIGQWLIKKNKTIKSYYKNNIWNEYDSTYELYHYANYVQLLSQSKNCKLLQYATPSVLEFNFDAEWNKITFPKHSILSTMFTNTNLSKALDRIHPGIKHHELFAEQVIKDIIQLKDKRSA